MKPKLESERHGLTNKDNYYVAISLNKEVGATVEDD